MAEFFIARQPIFNAQLKLHAYELLFRDSKTNRAPESIADNQATADVLTTSTEIGLDRLVGDRLAFINVPHRFLQEPDLLPVAPDQAVLEILETVEMDETALAGMQALREEGYTLALDDFIYDPSYEAALPMVDVIKLDIRAIERSEWEIHLTRLKATGCKLLAEKVETQEEFDYLASLGCDYFQGYFFARPQVVTGKRLSANKIGMLQLLSRINESGIDVETLADLVSRDVALSVRALNYVNSAANALNRRIESVREAIIYLGRDTIRRWVTLFVMASVDDKPDELMTMALIRGKLCELLAAEAGAGDEDAYFTVGLLSILDALMDAPMTDVLSQMAVTPDMQEALLSHRGRKGDALNIAINLEIGVLAGATFGDLQPDNIVDLHYNAMNWADEALMEMGVTS